MAFEARKIHPLDLEPRKAVGVLLPFASPAVFESTYQTKDAIKANLLNFLLTESGERYLNPTFGTYLQTLLFEPLTDNLLLRIPEELTRILLDNFPRIEVVRITADGDPDAHILQIVIKYKVLDTNIEDELIINVEM